MYILGVLVLICGIVISVGIHEVGHLYPAKRFGVKVSRYFIGFGPTLFSRTINGTEYGIKAILLGGYVSIAGMLPPAKPGTRIYTRKGQLTLAEEARQASAEEIESGEEDQAFWRLPARKKLVVMFGGPLTNAVIALVLLTIVMSTMGMSTLTTTIGSIQPCVHGSECSAHDPHNPATPAALSQLQVGDTIQAWGGVPVENWDELSAAIAAGGMQELPVSIIRDGKPMTVQITPIDRALLGTDSASQSDDSATQHRPYVGISPTVERQRVSLTRVPAQAADMTLATAGILVKLPVNLWNTSVALFSDQERDPNSAIGIVGVADLAGNITASGNAQYSGMDRLADLLMLLASLNISLFLFNLIPLLPLDGGHILGAVIEGSRRHIARWRGRPDPGAFDTARLTSLSNIVFILLIGMTILLVAADIFKPAF
ncbi:M50 family metallopeptidase [Trueperella sp. LYQ143]|uniref:M50 family metallopeptidase n=1 Tax=Trueperella sp. LYQ143 TaxID=3391059 RepID=UPI0039835EA4